MNTLSMFKNFISVSLLTLAMASPSLAFEMRTWTAMNGKTTEAAYVRYDPPNVILQRRDGNIININRDKLSDEDWLYVSQYDRDILSFWTSLGEVPVHLIVSRSEPNHYSDATPIHLATGKNDIDNLEFNHWPNTRNIHDDTMWKAMTRLLSKSPAKMMRVHASSDGLLLVDFNSEWKVVLPMPKDPADFFTPPTPDWPSRRHATSNYSIKLEKSRYFIVSRWYSIWSNEPTVGHADSMFLLAINASNTSSEYGHTIENKISDQFAINEKFKTDVRFFILDTEAAKTLSNMGKKALNISTRLHQNARYSRLMTLIRKKQSGVPSDTSLPVRQKVLGSGSGFFITTDGYFLTNYHVVRGGGTIRLMSAQGSVPAKAVRIDPAVDLALLKVDSGTFQSIPFLETDEVALGSDIFTIGFPMPDLQGFSPKMTKGVISSMKGIQDDEKEYQIDAAIQPGNSGGPVVNNNGEIVGVVVASLREQYVAETRGILPQNVNYAIKKKHVLDFISKVPNCFRGIKTSNLPTSASSASPATVDSVLKSCAMVIIYE